MYESTDKMVSHPNHYQSKYGFEVIDVIEEYTQELSGILATDTANMLKYICRWRHKNGIQDLEKSIWYATHLKDKWNSPKFKWVRVKMRLKPARQYIPQIRIGAITEAFTEAFDSNERRLTSNAIMLACKWWLCEDVNTALQQFIDNVHELITYEKAKGKKHYEE